MPGSLIVCPTPIGNLDDITLRARDALVAADYIACEDTRRTGGLLDKLGIRPAPPLVSNHEGNEASRATELAQRIERGDTVVARLRRRDAGDLRPRLPADPALHRTQPRGRPSCPAPRWSRWRWSPPACRPTAGASRASCRSARGRWSGSCARPRPCRLRVAAPGRRVAGGAGGDRARPPGRGLPRADQDARGGLARLAGRTGAALPRRRQGRDRAGDRPGLLRGPRRPRRRLRRRRPPPPGPVGRPAAGGGERRRRADRDPRQRPLPGADRQGAAGSERAR